MNSSDELNIPSPYLFIPDSPIYIIMIMMIQPARTSMDPPQVLRIFHPHNPPTQHSNSSTIPQFLFASSTPNALSSPNPSI